MNYEVVATRWEHGWELDIAGVGVTQSHSLRDAENMARDYIALDTGADLETINVHITPQLDGRETDAAALRAQVAKLMDDQRQVAERSRALTLELERLGLNGADIAAVLGLSPQRVSQLRRTERVG